MCIYFHPIKQNLPSVFVVKSRLVFAVTSFVDAWDETIGPLDLGIMLYPNKTGGFTEEFEPGRVQGILKGAVEDVPSAIGWVNTISGLRRYSKIVVLSVITSFLRI